MKKRSCFKLFILIVIAFEFSAYSAICETDSWRQYPNGLFQTLQSYSDFVKLPKQLNKKSFKKAEQIVSEPIFFISDAEMGRYNLWAMLEVLERTISLDEIPHFVPPFKSEGLENASIKYFASKYGAPDSIGNFVQKLNKDKKSQVYWYGPICLIFDKDGKISNLGGWPSRLGQSIASIENKFLGGNSALVKLLPSYEWSLIQMNEKGQVPADSYPGLIKVQNLQKAPVLVGLRAKDTFNHTLGFDVRIPPMVSANLPVVPGKYNIFVVFDDKPNSVFKGDDITI